MEKRKPVLASISVGLHAPSAYNKIMGIFLYLLIKHSRFKNLNVNFDSHLGKHGLNDSSSINLFLEVAHPQIQCHPISITSLFQKFLRFLNIAGIRFYSLWSKSARCKKRTGRNNRFILVHYCVISFLV